MPFGFRLALCAIELTRLVAGCVAATELSDNGNRADVGTLTWLATEPMVPI